MHMRAVRAQAARALIERLFPNSSCREQHGGYQVFEVQPAEGRSRSVPFQLGPIFAALDKAKEELGLENYTLSQTTLEQVGRRPFREAYQLSQGRLEP